MLFNRKSVTWRHLQPGQEIKGYGSNGSTCMFTAYVKEVNAAFVTVEMWSPGGRIEKIDADAMFSIEMTRKEIEAKYFTKAKEVLNNIQIKLHNDEIGRHEMWNAWLDCDPYSMAQYCIEHKFNVVGYCTDIIPKTSWLSGEVLDVGVCIEYEDGDRFWCHWRSRYIEEMITEHPELSEVKVDEN